jgi:hypothetical protein
MTFEVDADTRKVVGKILFEKPEGYGYILGYYPEAFTKWRGIIREMFVPTKAVGKAIEIIPDPEECTMTIVSSGAQDTLQRIVGGDLSAYGVAFIPDSEYGNNQQRWDKKEYQGKEYPYLPRYTITGISYIGEPPAEQQVKP